MFTKGAKIEITREAHAYSYGGFTDPTCIIPEEVQVMTVKAVRRTKKGTRVYFIDDRNCGFAVDVDIAKHHKFRAVGA